MSTVRSVGPHHRQDRFASGTHLKASVPDRQLTAIGKCGEVDQSAAPSVDHDLCRMLGLDVVSMVAQQGAEGVGGMP